MNNAPKTATLLVELLKEQHKARSPHLFRQGTFTLAWRAKVGSFPFPNLKTIVSAAEPCGRFDWRSQKNADDFHYDQEPPNNEDREKRVPEYFGDLSELAKDFKGLPLNGYIPGSAIRGIVRAWAMQQSPDTRKRAICLLGKQESDSDKITPGKIEFLDAWPEQSQPLAIDVVNPQEKFQVYHDNNEQPAPHALYTLGNGSSPVPFTVAIRGISGKVSDKEFNKVWQWVEQALTEQGLGGRTASGYGMLESASTAESAPDPTHQIQRFDFTLYSQGSEGAIQDTNQKELRPSHWRGWLRSWTLRFLLGVMSETNAKIILEDLFGAIESTQDGNHRKGCVRIQLLPRKLGEPWGELSKLDESRQKSKSRRESQNPDFYIWKGQIQISAPEDILQPILLPIIKVAASVGGVGRGWRRPLHFFVKQTENGDRKLKFSRGTHLILSQTGDASLYRVSLETNQWSSLYTKWAKAVRQKWGDRGAPNNVSAEVFSPKTCAVYAVPGPVEEPIDFDGTRSRRGAQKKTISLALAKGPHPGQQSSSSNRSEIQRSQTIQWSATSSAQTRGDGMNLIYSTPESRPPRNYKGNREVGGQAARGGSKSSFCSWVSIRRIDEPHREAGTECQEIVCLFLGKQEKQGFHRNRYQFLRDLETMEDSHHLFGVRASSPT